MQLLLSWKQRNPQFSRLISSVQVGAKHPRGYLDTTQDSRVGGKSDCSKTETQLFCPRPTALSPCFCCAEFPCGTFFCRNRTPVDQSPSTNSCWCPSIAYAHTNTTLQVSALTNPYPRCQVLASDRMTETVLSSMSLPNAVFWTHFFLHCGGSSSLENGLWRSTKELSCWCPNSFFHFGFIVSLHARKEKEQEEVFLGNGRLGCQTKLLLFQVT